VSSAFRRKQSNEGMQEERKRKTKTKERKKQAKKNVK
jgi:hypothetical protein